MATAIKLRNDIKKLKAAIASKATPKSFLPKLKSQLEKAENELDALNKGGKPRKTSTSKGTKSTLSALQRLIQRKKYRVYQGQGVDLKKDAEEGALATGRRVSKGLKANQFGGKGDNKGNVYYEYRPNRLDVKQPKKAQKYPKLEKGGFPDMLKEDDFVWNAVGKKLVVDKVTDSEYFLTGFMQASPSPFSKNKVHEYIKKGEWSLKPKMAKGGEIRYKLAGNNFGQQIENGQKFKELIKKAFESQTSEHKYPENFIKETAFTGKIVKSDGSHYLKDYTYKGTLTKFDFLDNEYFLQALKYVDRPAIKTMKFEEGGVMGKGGGIYSSDNLYILTVSKDGNKVGEERFRAKNIKEAKEMGEEYEEKYKEKFGGDLSFNVTEAMADGGQIKWQDAQIGDSARVLSENKTGLIMQAYGRKFHLRFPDDSEKTYDAKELEFIKDEDDFFDNGGEVHVADHFKKGGETFSENQLKELLDEALTYFYHGLNKLDVVNRYLEITGQGGMKTALSDKLNLAGLKDSIEKIDDYTS